MPLLDITELLCDPELVDSFTVLRRQQAVDNHGWATANPITTYNDVLGTVCSASPNDLRRLPEDQQMEKTISIVTTFRLQGPSKADTNPATATYQPDIINWHGSSYVVVWIDDYTQYGQGQVQALAQSTTYVDPAPPGAPVNPPGNPVA